MRKYFIDRVAEEAEPVLCLVKCFREEDEVGTVAGCGFNVDSPQLDIFAVDQLRF